jgi:two-component system sensor histidine kinase/response regulator
MSSPAEVAEGGRYRVLFVDDERPNLIAWRATCGDEFEALTAQSGDEALRLMREGEVAVVLADQRMPRQTGVELLEEARREFPSTVRMLITAHADVRAAADAINRGQVFRYLRKPWEPDELRAALHEGCEVYAMAQKIRALERRLIETERVYALGVIASSVAHELRSPVGWMASTVDVAKDLLAEALETLPDRDQVPRVAAQIEEARQSLSDVELGCARLEEIVQGLMLPTRGTGDDTVDVAEVLRLALRIVRRDLEARAELRLEAAPVPRATGSSTKVGQVVLNLLVNAIQALAGRPRGEALITARLWCAGHVVSLEVSDNGPGIAAEDLPRVFDPFFTTKANGGTGLGLAISRRIAEETGGRLEASSGGASGARFVLTLPVARGQVGVDRNVAHPR